MAEPIDSGLLVSFGGPEGPDDVVPFLENVLRNVSDAAGKISEIAPHYMQFGGRSPINEHTAAQAQALEAALREDGLDVPVRVGNRHWKPFAAEALRAIVDGGARRTAGVVMAAQRSGAASYDKYVKVVENARAALGERAPEVIYTESFHAHPGFIDAVTDRIDEADPGFRAARAGDGVLLFTAHSIPTAAAKATPYVSQLEESCEAVAARVRPRRWRLVYHSRSGRPSDPWLEPDVCDALADEKGRGTRSAVVAPIGFLSDHMEVLYDLDVEAADAAQRLDLRLIRARTVLDHPRFIRALADAVRALQ